jgi:GLPGLI family protein
MKNLTLICFLFISIVFNKVKAQTKGELIYSKYIDDKFTSSPRTESYSVYFDKDRSLEVPRRLDAKSRIQNVEGSNETAIYLSMKEGSKHDFILKDFKANNLIFANDIDFKFYLIEDTLANFKWKITDEKKQILKFNCTKATTTFRGRNYEAWFTDEVPLRNGPWKFCGLPGLIVKVYDTENVYTFDLVSISFGSFDESKLTVPAAYSKDKIVTHPAFMEAYNKKVKDLEIESRASFFVNGNMSGSSKSSIPPQIEKF